MWIGKKYQNYHIIYKSLGFYSKKFMKIKNRTYAFIWYLRLSYVYAKKA